jgi:stearoyl-CoA desaturase (delta-9 desaturase)
MLVFGLISGLVAVTVTIGIAKGRMPVAVVRAGILLSVVIPFFALADAIWIGWGRWLGWREAALFAGFALLTGIGTGVGYHRLLTHRSFETRPAIKLVLLILGAMALPTRPLDFAANHLKHHAFSDHDGDPHTPLDGLFHAHVGWILAATPPDRARYCKGLRDDPVISFVDRTAMLWFALGLVIPYLLAGWPGLLWGGLIRVGYHNQVTFAVNSICHTFGRRSFPTNDESRNNWLLGLLAFGEGWHNNHHAFPFSARHGLRWFELDFTWWTIKVLAWLKIARDVKLPTPQMLQRLAMPPQGLRRDGA